MAIISKITAMHISDTVFWLALAFLLGVAAASFGWSIIAVVLIISISGFLILFLFNKTHLWKYPIIFAFFVFAGVFYYNLYLNTREAQTNLIFDEKTSFHGIVVSEPRRFEKYQSFTVKTEEPFSGEISVLAPPLAKIDYGDLLNFDGIIKQADSPEKDPSVLFPKIETVDKHRGNWLREKLIGFKQFLIGQFDEFLLPDEAALLGGITFGSRSDFSENLRGAMSRSGTTHLVALSGYNITILILAVAYVFNSFLSRRKTFYITIFFILFFVLMVGGEPSVVRAAIMGFLALLAREIGRLQAMRNAIMLTAGAMTLAVPTILINDVGFQLSFASLLGIVYLAPAIKKLLRIEDGGLMSWKENFVMTLSAQLAVFPIISATFGEFSLSAILANVLILGFVPFTMFLGFLLAALSSIYIYLGFFTAKLAELLLSYEIWIMQIFAGLRLPIAIPKQATWLITFAYYGALAILIYLTTSKTIIKKENGQK